MNTIKRRGCICCLLDNFRYRPSEVHHVIEGGKRLGHMYTIGLCEHHHRGVPMEGSCYDDTAAIFGPSLSDEPRRFKERYGDEQALIALQDVVNALSASQSYLAIRWYRDNEQYQRVVDWACAKDR